MGISRLQRFCDKWCEWSEKELRHQVQYLYTTAGWTLKFTYCGENWEDLWEAIYADAGECGKSDEDGKPGRAISGYLIVLEGHNGTFLPLAWLSKRQTVVTDASAASEAIAWNIAAKHGIALGMMVELFR